MVLAYPRRSRVLDSAQTAKATSVVTEMAMAMARRGATAG